MAERSASRPKSVVEDVIAAVQKRTWEQLIELAIFAPIAELQ
jgi:hypothetical protein